MLIITLLIVLALSYFLVAELPFVFEEPKDEKEAVVIGQALLLILPSVLFAVLLYFFQPYDGYSSTLVILVISLSIGLLANLTSYTANLKEKKKALAHHFASKEELVLGEQKTLIAELASQKEDYEVKEVQLEKEQRELQEKAQSIEKLKSSIQKKSQEQDIKSKELDEKERNLDEYLRLEIEKKELSIEQRLQKKYQNLNIQLREDYQEKLSTFVDRITEKMEQRILSEKEELIDDVFSFDNEGTDDVFELQMAKEALQQEKQEIQKNQFLLDVDQRVIKANEHVIAAKSSAIEVKSENVDLRSELQSMAKDFKMDLKKETMQREKSLDQMLHHLELEHERRKSEFRAIGDRLTVMDAQAKARLTEVASKVYMNLKDLEVKTFHGLRQVRESMSDMKLQFGQEIMRLDGQQGQILTELEKYYAKNQQFVNQCQSIGLEAKRQNLDGQQLLNKVNHLHQQHKLDTRDMESRLRSSMDHLAVKEGHLANSIGESMLKLKDISNQQYLAMRDMALEKKDVGLLWKEKNMEHNMNLQEIQHQKNDLDRTRQLFSQERSTFNQHKSHVMENAQLTHRSHMAEIEYKFALQKAQNSRGWLSRWARAIESK